MAQHIITRVSLRAEHEQWNSCWTLRLAQGRLALGAFSTLWVYRKAFRRYFKRTGRSLFFRHSFLANFVGFIVFSFTLGHNFPYPKIYFLGVGWLWLISKNHCGGPLKSNIAMVTKFPVLQQLHFGWNGFGKGFSLGWIPNFCCRFLSLIRFQVLLKKP